MTARLAGAALAALALVGAGLVACATGAGRGPSFPEPIDIPTDGGTADAGGTAQDGGPRVGGASDGGTSGGGAPQPDARAVTLGRLADGGTPAPSRDPRTESLFWVDGAAGRLRVSDGGDKGVPVIFVHGLGSSRDAWREALASLRPARRCVAYDQRGHGESDPARDGKYEIAGLADDLDAVVRALGIEKAFFVGHSMAGAVLTAYAGKHPDKVAGLLYVDAIGDFSGMPQDELQKWVAHFTSLTPQTEEQTFTEMLGAQARPQTKERVLADVRRVAPATVGAIWKSMAAFRAAEPLSRYKGPVLALDTPENTMPLAFWRARPGVQREVVPGTSHWLMMDDPAAFEAVLRRFVGGP